MSAHAMQVRQHPVHVVHRIGAGTLGIVLWVFAGLGYANGLQPFETQGQMVLGLSSNGLLSTISLAAGAVLIAAAAWRGPAASTTTAVMGGLFLVSGLVHLVILRTEWNILDFGLANVYFSLGAGMALLFLGLYGRLSGGLAPDNPYRVRRAAHDLERHAVPRMAVHGPMGLENALLEARRAEAEGRATQEQQELLAAQRSGRLGAARPELSTGESDQ